jgi:DNA polymerase-1
MKTKTTEQNRLLIIDALNLFIRNYVVNPTMDKSGIPIGGTIGFLKSLQKIMRETRPHEIIICWDGLGGSQRKKTQNKNYKEGRKPLRFNRRMIELDPKDQAQNKIHQQIRLYEYLNELPIMQLTYDGIEADDVIAVVARHEYYKDWQKIIISSDKDFFQLCNKDVVVYRPIQKALETEGTILYRFGIHPNNFALARAIAGDTSDNLKGVDRVGLKTVAKNFPILSEKKQYELDEIFQICEDTENKKVVHKNILAQRDLVEQNYSIMQLYNPSISVLNRNSIDYNISNFETESNHLNFKKMLFEDGQISINFTDLWNQLRKIKR